MRKLRTRAVLLITFVCVFGRASAWPTGIGIFAQEDPSERHRCFTAPAFATTSLYVIGFELGSFQGWEASVTFESAAFTILAVTLNPAEATNVGGIGNFIVGLGANFEGSPRYTLVSYQFGWFAGSIPPQDSQVCLGGTTPSSFGGAPGYATAQSQLVVLPFISLQTESYDEGCAVLNPTDPAQCEVSYPILEASFGRLKARF